MLGRKMARLKVCSRSHRELPLQGFGLGYGVLRKSAYHVPSFKLFRSCWAENKHGSAARLASHTS